MQQNARYILKDISTGITCVLLADIVWLEACEQYVCIHLANGSKIIQSKRLGVHMARLLGSGLFCRIHLSAVININYFVSVAKDRTVTLSNQLQLRASKNFYPHLLAMLGGY